ncbi:hypothetical protein AQUSIP_11600 [Aquicella siphonis]|uniref:Uncharacterized protein n=1 Tax=Aquicella siphonis TaxID=254247 RepID=A0A5E4PHL7_9COXI|nr:FimV/HubP family polar landmark protein [Aquicella siphonis]VVC75863.1 hypothetical protein AQUSIP_11600 [Aquicella siphonis]
MILLIIKSYLILLVSIGAGSLFMLAIGLYFIFRKPPPSRKIVLPANSAAQTASLGFQSADRSSEWHDLTAISGDDIIATQLDLARAYIESGKNDLAKTILHYVAEQGSASQQQEAQQLMIQI